MSERDDLLASVAETIKTYRMDELAQPTPEHVERWLSQFTPANQLPFLKEFDHVLKQTFITKDKVENHLEGLVTNKELTSDNPAAYWQSAHFLKIQQKGQSQKEMLKLFAKCLYDEYGLELDKCGRDGGDYIYLDDVIFSGKRVGDDLKQWIIDDAPQSAKIHVIVAVIHAGSYFTKGKLEETVKESGKQIKVIYWRVFEVENRKYYKNSSGILWPAVIPNVPEVQDYIALLPPKYFFVARQAGSAVVASFSSEQGRQVLESEFLIAGVKIISLSKNPKASMRPLGFSPFGVGFGSMIATYRNCPNNCPLALWWGNPEATSGALHWYPLLPRKTYAALENIFKDFDDDFDDFTT